MSSYELLLAVLVLGVGIFLARKSTPIARVVLFGTALVVSGLLFLPGPQLVHIFGDEVIVALARRAASTPLSLSDWAHVIAFFALGFLVWMGRPDLRGWKAWALMAVLAMAAEVAQELAPGRSPKFDDVLLNLAGGAIGLMFGCAVTWLFPSKQEPGRRE